MSAERLPPDVCWVPAGAPVPSSLSVVTVCRVVARLHGCVVTVQEAITALRVVELADRRHHRPADRLASEERLAVWLAIAALRQVPIVAVPGPQWYARPSDADWVPQLLREAADRHRLLLLLQTTSEMADAVGADRVEPRAPS